MLFPNMKETIKIWREEAIHSGIELYLCRVETVDCYGEEYLRDGFDAAIEFQPFTHQLDAFQKKSNPLRKFAYNLNRHLFNRCKKRIVDYSEYVNYVSKIPFPDYKMYPGVTPMWDNTSRRKKKMLLGMGALQKSTVNGFIR